MIKCIIFDMDGVLTETSVQHFQAWKVIADELEISIDWAFNECLKGVSRIESLNRILKHGHLDERFTETEKMDLANRKNEIYLKLIRQFDESHIFKGVRDLFEALAKADVKVAIGSASQNAPFLIRALGLSDLTNYIVNPTEVNKGKPAPDIFLKAMHYFGLTPEECIGVEDAEEGIKAIKSAGMFAIGIGDRALLRQADIIFESTEAMVKRILNEGVENIRITV